MTSIPMQVAWSEGRKLKVTCVEGCMEGERKSEKFSVVDMIGLAISGPRIDMSR